MKFAAVLAAGGFGSFDGNRTSKLIECIGGVPAVQILVETIKKAGIFSTIVMVVSDSVVKPFGQQIRRTLEQAGHNDVVFAYQPDRFGAADAVYRGMVELERRPIDANHVLVAFAEQPLWKTETILELAEVYEHDRPDVAMLTLPFQEGHEFSGHVRPYAFIDEAGVHIKKPNLVCPGTELIPSLYIFRLLSFQQLFCRIRPVENPDGRASEYHIPVMVDQALRIRAQVLKVPRFLPEQALGFNSLQELEMVRKVWQRWHKEEDPCKKTLT